MDEARTLLKASVLALGLSAIACGGEPAAVAPSPPTPSPVPSPAPSATGTLVGYVHDDSGNPIANATVYALVGRAPFANPTTGADGSFRLDDLTLDLTVTVRVFKIRYVIAETQFLVKESNSVNMTLHPVQQTMLSGFVRDVESGGRVAGAIVSFDGSPGDPNSGTQTVTGRDGRYVFDHVYVGSANIRASAPGYRDWVTSMNVTGSTEADLLVRKIEAPLVFTGTIGGSPESWTCRITITHPKLGTLTRPCQQFPITMRRSGTVSVTLTWSGPETMDLDIVGNSNGVPLNGVSSYSTGQRRLDLRDVFVGGPGTGTSVRVAYDQGLLTVTPFTLTVDRND